MTFGNAWRQRLLWTLECPSSYLCVRAHTVETNCVWRMCTRVRSNKWIWERVCVRSSSPGLCFSCRVSPICHGLYLVRRSQPNSMGDASERREPGRRSAWWLRCAASRTTRTETVVTLAEGGGGSRRGRDLQWEPSKHSSRSSSYRSIFNSVIVCVKWTKDHKRLVWK